MSLPPASEQEARDLVDRIVRTNGFVSETSLDSMTPRVRKEVEEALLRKDEKIGASVLTLAKNLYTSSARFVFELLQNTDDNEYTTAQKDGHDPSVSFRLYHDRLVVDCNEDGFTEKNLSAICDIGNSSKSGSQGYIGEKGIGFKSVFMAAYKVHIQSGHLSFSFVHRKGDSGMGMVKPIWEGPTEALPQANHTRITLFLHESEDDEQTSREREDIQNQFRELEPALLLFVRKLRRIDVAFHDKQDQQEWATRLTRHPASETNRVVLNRLSAGTGALHDVAPESHIYHVTEHMATNVARHDNRELSALEEISPSSRQSKIVLAFPVSAQSLPIIEQQKVFAFLPMKQMGFNFLIQADFVTQANREDVVTTSARNKDLIKAVIDAVMHTIRQFCEHETLQYTWMRYLPRDGTHHWDPFWKELVDGIKRCLRDEPVIRSRAEGVLRRLPEMRNCPETYKDRHGDPLFPDHDPGIYIADSYDNRDIGTLKHFGLPTIKKKDIIVSINRDLLRPRIESIIRSPSTDNDWHTRASRVLQMLFKGGSKIADDLRQLAIIPLESGAWISAVDGYIFYGSIGNMQIPKDLGFRIVASGPAENAERRALFDSLGVQKATIAMVRSRIMNMYARGEVGDIGFDHSLEHLKFLYFTHGSRSEEENYPELLLYNHLGHQRDPLDYDLYIQDDNPYGAQRLLGGRVMSSFDASFVDPRYFERAPTSSSGASPSWVEWMHEYVGVMRNVRLHSPDETSLSEECKHIAQHRSGSFLGFLRHVWPGDGKVVAEDKAILEELAGIPVTCMNGKTVPLSACYMPLRELRSVQSRFTGPDAVPFLDIQSSDDASLLSEWFFLTDVIGVHYEDDLRFRLHLLEAFADSNEGGVIQSEIPRLIGLYLYIEAFCMGSENTRSMRARVYDRVSDRPLVLAPFSKAEWVKPQECLWEAPRNFATRRPLRLLYKEAGIDGDRDDVRQFFQGTLHIPDITHKHIVEELCDMRDRAVNIESVRGLYGMLQEMFQRDQSIADDLRNSFEEKGLVYVERWGSPGWYSPSQCLWFTTTSIDGKVAINGQYAGLEKLFRKALSVSSLNLTMVHRELLGAESAGATTERIKQLLLNFSSLLPSEPQPPTPHHLLRCCIFPVMSSGHSNTTLCTAETEFVILDRDGLFVPFGDRVRCLDFSLKDVCRLRPLINWAGLESRYLSRCLEEVSKVQNGMEWPIRDSKQDIKNKAHGLLRIASKYESPRFKADPHTLYDLLRTAETVEAEGISSTLVLRQDGHAHEHEVSHSNLHIEERDGSLKVYVPRGTEAREGCFLTTLPRRLLSWMMAPSGSTETVANKLDDAALSVVIPILSCSISTVPSILDSNGVPDVEDVTEVPLPAPDDADAPVTPTRRGDSSNLLPWSPENRSSSAVVTPEPRSSPENDDGSYITPSTDPEDYESNGFGEIPSTPLVDNSAYERLVESAVTMAERIAWRDYGSTSATDAFDNLSLQDDDVFTGPSSMYYLSRIAGQRFKIGAAGELFVFVLLSNLLPAFGMDNWRSTIRHHAAAHTRYRNITRWVGRETSDIVYNDASGVFTSLLLEKGHLSGNEWAGATPRYYIEVKSTLDQCATPFYVSHDQAERMLRTTNGPSGSDNVSDVYIIFRVFNLGTESTGLQLYVDPQEQRRTGRLRFTTDTTYTVTPGVRA